MQTFAPTTCPLDCPATCALIAEIRHDRLHAIKGDPDHPFTRGVICAKVARYHELQNGPRLEHPLIRTGDKGEHQFRQATWDEALDLVAEKFQSITAQYGPEAILPYHYGGTMGILQRGALDRLTHRAGWTRLEKTICFPIGAAGWNAGINKEYGPDPAEVAQSDFIILWGINAVTTCIPLMGHIKQARRHGATLVVIDPYRNRSARMADLYVPIRPGTDGALATAMMNVLLTEGMADLDYLTKMTDWDDDLAQHIKTRTSEWAAPITGLEAETIRDLARRYGHARAPFIRIGLGMSRQNNGAVNIHAVSALPAVAGAWRTPGGGAAFATGGGFPIKPEAVRREAWIQPDQRLLDMSLLGEHLLDPDLEPPVMALYVSHANPAVTCPDSGQVVEGLRREDLFTVVHEQVMSDTARWADVILPATTFLEHEDLYKAYGQYTLQHAAPVLPPRGEARCNHDVVNDLARRLGFDDPPFTWDTQTMVAEVLKTSDLPPRAQWPGRWLDFSPSSEAGRFTQGFPTLDGKFHFRPNWGVPGMPPWPDHWAVNQRHGPDADRYPLDFLTPPSHEVLNSTFSSLNTTRERMSQPQVWIHPTDAEARGIRDQMRVVVFNAVGRLTMRARVTDEVPPGVTLCESNRGAEDFPEKRPLNSLNRASRTPPHGGPALHDNRVEIRPA